MLSRREVMAGAGSALVPKREPLAPVTSEAVALIRRNMRKVVEIGAGDGAWAAALRKGGVRVEAYDIQPRGPGVRLGSHLDAAKHPTWGMLAVWPPDGPEVQRWISAAPWPIIFLCGVRARFHVGATLNDYVETEALVIPGGRKGGSTLRVWKRNRDAD